MEYFSGCKSSSIPQIEITALPKFSARIQLRSLQDKPMTSKVLQLTGYIVCSRNFSRTSMNKSKEMCCFSSILSLIAYLSGALISDAISFAAPKVWSVCVLVLLGSAIEFVVRSGILFESLCNAMLSCGSTPTVYLSSSKISAVGKISWTIALTVEHHPQ